MEEKVAEILDAPTVELIDDEPSEPVGCNKLKMNFEH